MRFSIPPFHHHSTRRTESVFSKVYITVNLPLVLWLLSLMFQRLATMSRVPTFLRTLRNGCSISLLVGRAASLMEGVFNYRPLPSKVLQGQHWQVVVLSSHLYNVKIVSMNTRSRVRQCATVFNILSPFKYPLNEAAWSPVSTVYSPIKPFEGNTYTCSFGNISARQSVFSL